MTKLPSSLSALVLAPLLALAAPTAAAQVPALETGKARGPALEVTPILGDDTTWQPTALAADLDAGDLVLGRTWWEFQPDIVWVETFLGFLWAPDDGIAVFEVPLPIYFMDLLTFPADVAPDRTVVGTMTSTASFESWPFRWTPAAGVEWLIAPGSGLGSATTVSDDGALVGGSTRASLFGAPQAARWDQGLLQVLGPPGLYSYVSGGSADGSVLIGDVGPDLDTVQATRWIDGVEVALAPVPGASTSSALFVSDDGQTAIGSATVAGGKVLVRWAADGTVATFPAPGGLGLETIGAINPDATAVVGALSDDPTPYQGNWVPFRWRESDGFTLIDELGLPDEYTYSQATDVSDDGTRVVGNLGHWVYGPGSEQPAAVLWTEQHGTRDLELVQQAWGGEPLGLFTATAISGDGKRILASGTEAPSASDSTAVILSFLALP